MAPTRYSDDEIRQATAGASSFREAAKRLGAALNSSMRGRMRSVGGLEGTRPHRVPDAEFVETIKSARSWRHALTLLGHVHGNPKHLKKRAQRLGISISRRGWVLVENESLFSYDRCQGKRTEGTLLKNRLLKTGRPYVCVVCNLGDSWNGSKLTLQVDHADGDRLNNNADNLRFLCPNCHSQTSTFRGRNIAKH